MSTLIVGGVVFLGIALAARSVYKSRKRGGCSGCSGCGLSSGCDKLKHH